MNASKFTAEVVKELSRVVPSFKVTVKANLELVVTNAAGKESTVFLDNAYNTYLQDPSAVVDVIHRYAVAYSEVKDEGAKVDRTRIVPIIKDRRWLADIANSLKERGANKPLENVFDDYNEGLVVVYAEDSPRNIRYVTPKDLDEIGIPRNDLRAIAISNLKRLLPKVEVHSGPLVSMVTVGGDYEASLLLLDIWLDGTIKVDGDIVVAIPSRELLLVTGSNNAAGISKLRAMASKSFNEASYRLTDELFVFSNGRFIKFSRP
jgi:uncharacterized protein YtpQ (UPF0354 family)